jgi:hypothetical protein
LSLAFSFLCSSVSSLPSSGFASNFSLSVSNLALKGLMCSDAYSRFFDL